MSTGFIVADLIVYFISLYVFYKVGFRMGVKKEQQARLRRLNALRKILNGNL